MRYISGMKKAIILLSGGIDSTTTLYLAKQKGYRLIALIFDYNQRHRREIQSAKKIARRVKVPYRIVKIDLSWTKSSLTDSSLAVPRNRSLDSKVIPLTYVSGRNIIFLSYAFSFAESMGAQTVFIGAHIQDYSGYPDCRPQFLKSFERAANLGLKRGVIKIMAPLINKSKQDIIKIGIKLGIPFEYTWSCYRGGKVPCLSCDSCRFRTNAFKELGLIDPLLSAKKSV